MGGQEEVRLESHLKSDDDGGELGVEAVEVTQREHGAYKGGAEEGRRRGEEVLRRFFQASVALVV